MNEDQAALLNFKGVAKLFPLPGLVFFPHTVQPLHIFEPRYRQMMADALGEDHLLSLVLLDTGWEHNYDQKPTIHPIACLGRIITHEQLPDGRYNLILRGLARLRIDDELSTDRLYRQANVTVLTDEAPSDIADVMQARQELADLVLPRFTQGQAREHVQGLFHGEMPLGQLCDVLTFALPLPPETKQLLLGTTHVVERARHLMTSFTEAVAKLPKPKAKSTNNNKFPPDFSAN